MTAPKEKSVSLVKEWLQGEIPSAKVSLTGEYLTVESNVNAIERLLKTTYSTYGRRLHPCFAECELIGLTLK